MPKSGTAGKNRPRACLLKCANSGCCALLIAVGLCGLYGSASFASKLRYDPEIEAIVGTQLYAAVLTVLISSVLLIAFGILGILSSCGGCCGLVPVLVFLPIIFFTWFTACIYLYFLLYRDNQADFWNNTQTKLTERIANYTGNSEWVDGFQKSLKCCGVVDHDSFKNLGFVPKSCCPTSPREKDCWRYSNSGEIDRNADLPDGCQKALIRTFEEYFRQFSIIGCALGLLTTITITITFFLTCMPKFRTNQTLSEELDEADEMEPPIQIIPSPRIVSRNPLGNPTAPPVEMVETIIPEPDYPLDDEVEEDELEATKYAYWAPVVKEYQQHQASRRF